MLKLLVNISRTSLKFNQRSIYKLCEPELDVEYLINSNNIEEISNNIEIRKGVGDIRLAIKLKNQLDNLPKTSETSLIINEAFKEELKKIPNKTHPEVINYKNDPKILSHVGEKRLFSDFEPRQFDEIVKRLNMVRTEQLGNLTGNRSYYVMGELAELEHALVQYTIGNLIQSGFMLVSVPDILPREVIERCGMNTRGERNQVYTLEPESLGENQCLSGTSEMALAAYNANTLYSEKNLPLKLCTISRCFRAETSSTAEERGIYRVHEFTKVEMFSVTTPEQSDNMFEEFRQMEENLFVNLGLHFRTLDMPPSELGAPAYRKYDIEAWLPGRGIYGEISSCSNCTDYQSRRLGIKYRRNDNDAEHQHVHTLNGTACAIPRMLIAIVETYQNNNGTVNIPEVLRRHMRDKTKMGRQKKVPELRLIKNKK